MFKKLISLSLVLILVLSLGLVVAVSASAAEEGLYINMGGKTYFAKVGDVITYKVDLCAEQKFVNFQVRIDYDNTKLRPMLYPHYDNSVLPWQDMYGDFGSEVRLPNTSGVTLNIQECIRFNGVRLYGYDFTTEKNFFNVEMLVTNPGYTNFDLVFEGMAIDRENYYFDYTTGEQVTEGITIKEYLSATPLENAPDKSEIDNGNLTDTRDKIKVYFYAPEKFVNNVSAYSFDSETSEEYLGLFRNRGTVARDAGNGYYYVEVPVGTDYVAFTNKRAPYALYASLNVVSDIIPLADKDIVAVPDGTVTKDSGFDVYGVRLCDVSEMPEKPTTPVATKPVATEPVATETVVPVTYPIYDGTEKTQYISLNDGNRYAFEVGDTFTYTVYLKASELFEDFQAKLYYDSNALKLNRVSDNAEEESVTYVPNLGDNLVLNARDEGRVAYNSIRLRGFDFKEETVLLTLEFTVISGGSSDLDHEIQEMTIKGGYDSYFSRSEPEITEGISIRYELSSGTQVEPTIPPTTVPTEPVTFPVVTDPVLVEPDPDYPIMTYPNVPDYPIDPTPTGDHAWTLPGSPALPGSPVVTEPCVTEPSAADPVPTEPCATWPAEGGIPTPTAPPVIAGDDWRPESSDKPTLSPGSQETAPAPAEDATSATESDKDGEVDVPKTGDMTLWYLVALMTVIALSVALITFRNKKFR